MYLTRINKLICITVVITLSFFAQCFGHDITKTDGNISIEITQQMDNELSVLPDELVDKFINNGWNLYVTDKNINHDILGGEYTDSVGGVTVFDSKVIYIANNSNAVEVAALHEFGHFVDQAILNWYSSTESFLEAYNEEKDMFKHAYSVNIFFNEKECFAELFRRYYNDKDRLKEKCPKLYEQIRIAVEESMK